MSNTISSSQLMMQQMQQMQMQAKSNILLENNPLALNPGNEQIPTQVSDQVSFSDLLKGAVDHVNGMQQHAGDLKRDFTMGKEGVDLVEVMIASEKSSVAFTALMETSRKMMTAYNEIKRFRV
jgi:flagellar hook-basal body complex protein FliE